MRSARPVGTVISATVVAAERPCPLRDAFASVFFFGLGLTPTPATR
jgi:predicted Kef-type K+ transport protein